MALHVVQLLIQGEYKMLMDDIACSFAEVYIIK